MILTEQLKMLILTVTLALSAQFVMVHAEKIIRNKGNKMAVDKEKLQEAKNMLASYKKDHAVEGDQFLIMLERSVELLEKYSPEVANAIRMFDQIAELKKHIDFLGNELGSIVDNLPVEDYDEYFSYVDDRRSI